MSTADCPEIWRGEIEGSWITRRRFELPLELPPGHHELEVKIGASALAPLPLDRVAAASATSPPRSAQGRRLWGVAVQLYTVRSRRNWGIGDFRRPESADPLARATRGAGFIGLNPLHALAPADPERASPYSASNRHFLNVLYISVPHVPEFENCAAARARIGERGFAARSRGAARAHRIVDYARRGGDQARDPRVLFGDFCDRHLAHGTERAAAFRGFVAAGGQLLQMHARFDALDRHLLDTQGTPSGWLSWPRSSAIRIRARVSALCGRARTRDRVLSRTCNGWRTSSSRAAQALARELGMPIGLYGDYAVGTHPSGSETWVDQTGYRLGAEIGAPPDPLALKVRAGALPPPDPVVMESRHLEGFIRLLRNNMRYYGALRLDHVMSLFRLWWVAAGRSPVDGAYVHYPLHQLLTALALESARSACVVVGEDLGVVPDEMRRAMPQFGSVSLQGAAVREGRRPLPAARRIRAPRARHRHHARHADACAASGRAATSSCGASCSSIRPPRSSRTCGKARARDREALLAALKEQGLAPAIAGLARRALHARARARDARVSRALERDPRRDSDRGSARDGRSGQRAGNGSGVSELAAQAHAGCRTDRCATGSRRAVCRHVPGPRLSPPISRGRWSNVWREAMFLQLYNAVARKRVKKDISRDRINHAPADAASTPAEPR